jgi:hypothetical protein
VVGGQTLRTLQVPTTLPTLDELLGLEGRTPDQVNAEVLDLLKEDALNVYALHTEVEGGALAGTFDAFLAGLAERGVRVRTHQEWLPEWLAARPPARTIVRKEIPGRAGWVSFEGGIVAEVPAIPT